MNMNIDSVNTATIFTKSECENIIKMSKLQPIGEAAFFARTGLSKGGIRSTKAIEITDDGIGNYVFAAMKKMNSLQFELSNHEPLQLLKYDVDDHYTWHTDWSPVNNKKRKLSMTIQLSDPSEYEGGDVEIMDGPESRLIPKDIGSGTVFPSWAVHRVTPITSGTRWALIVWAIGKPFK